MEFNSHWETSISIESLRSRLDYDPATGALTRKKLEQLRPGQRRSDAGKIATRLTEQGYLRCMVLDRQVMAHRVAWAIHHGEWPPTFIDHIDGDRTNNAISNLRLASRKENNRNAIVRADNESGFKGVSYRKARWYARIRAGGRMLHLGSFLTQAEAIAAHQGAAIALHREFRSQRAQHFAATPLSK